MAGQRREAPSSRVMSRPSMSLTVRRMSDKPRYYITTAIAYPNGAPHIGYGYEIITTDAIARFKRLDGYDVFFLTGTDEHGIKIAQTAAKEGTPPKQPVDRHTDPSQ